MSGLRAEPSSPAGKTDGTSTKKPKAASTGPLAGPNESSAQLPATGSATGAVQPTGERGGPKGPEPTRYGDWEKGGRCFDF